MGGAGVSEANGVPRACLPASSAALYWMANTQKLAGKDEKRGRDKATSFSYPRSESNRDQRNRNPLFYPLNYRGIP